MKFIMLFIVLLIILYLILFFTTNSNSIPKIIHQTAPADKSKWNKVWFECQKSWIDLHPDFEYKFWSDEDLDTFMKTEYPEYYEMFTSYDENIKRIDASRYFILHKYGGIYADMDYKCQHRFFEELPHDKISVARSIYTWDNGFQNALMISKKDHKIWNIVFNKLVENKDVKGVLECTGPTLLSSVLNENVSYVNPLSLEEYNPFYNNENDSVENYRHAKAIHMHTASWIH